MTNKTNVRYNLNYEIIFWTELFFIGKIILLGANGRGTIMNKKELADIRKEFKNEYSLIKPLDMYSVYVKMDMGNVIHKEFKLFEALEEEVRELYIANFKKILSGTMDTKLFELAFKNTEDEENSQKLLYNAYASSEKEVKEANYNKLIEKIMNNSHYEGDVVINFLEIEYTKNQNSKRKKNGYNEGMDDVISSINFILCSISEVNIPKKAIIFDYEGKEFKINSALDTMINLENPLDGFMFPSITEGEEDIHRIMYYCSKPKNIDAKFIQEVLNCDLKLTAEAEKTCFNEILKQVIGIKIKPEVIKKIYEGLNQKLEDDEESEAPSVGIKEVKKILELSGITKGDVESAFGAIIGQDDYDFKVENIIPNFKSKSVKIANSETEIAMSPSSLDLIKQVRNEDGKLFLQIEITEDLKIEGFSIQTEAKEEE